MILFLCIVIAAQAVTVVALLVLHRANVDNQAEIVRLLAWLEWRIEHLEKEAMAKGDWWSRE